MAIRQLYICEKADQAMKVAKELGPVGRKDGWVECANNVVVTWASGHIYQLFSPEDYRTDWKSWSWDTLPIIPVEFRFKVAENEKSKKMVKAINGLLDQAQEVVVATDPDREGELIAYEIIVEKKYKGPIKRAIWKDLTPAAIRTAIANLEPGEKYYPWYLAALARTEADYMVGMTMTRAWTMKMRRPGTGSKPLSIGRVQTPTLALLVRQERRIQNFKPQTYFELVAEVSTAGGHKLKMRFRPPEDRRIVDPAQIATVQGRAHGAKGPLVVAHELKEKDPPPLLELLTLQAQGNSRFGWSADKTLEIAQKLYDGSNGAKQALITYPRGDCAVLPEEHIGRIAEQVKNLTSIPSLAHLDEKLGKPIIRASVYDDTKVTAHTAIVPTLEKANIGALTDDERKIYELVSRYYLAAHMPAYQYMSTKVTLDANGVPLAVGGTVPKSQGWRDAFSAFASAEDDEPGDDEEGGSLPPVKDGEPARVDKADVEKRTTEAPKRLTESKLLLMMKNITAHVEMDAAAKKRLKQTLGIGTPATRANIIKTLKDRGYIEVKKRSLVPTEVGMELIAAIEKTTPDYADAVVTARWEDGLEMIAQKQLTVADFLKAISDKLRRDVVTVRDRADLGMIGGEGDASKGPFVSREAREEIEKSGFEVGVKYGQNDQAKALGLVWVAARTCWMAPASMDKAKLIQLGWLNADGTRAVPQKSSNVSPEKRADILKNGIDLRVKFGETDKAKELGAVFAFEEKIWRIAADADKAPFIALGWLNADGSLPPPPPRPEGGGNFQKSGKAGGSSGSKPAAKSGGGVSKGNMIKLDIPFDRRQDARALGAKWNAEEKAWCVPVGTDLTPYKKAGLVA